MKSLKPINPGFDILSQQPWRPNGAAVTVFFLMAVLAALVIWYSERTRLQIAREDVSHHIQDHAQTIQISIERVLSATFSLAALVRQGKGDIENFESTAREMLPFFPGAACFQLAPGGIVRKIVPLAGNENAIGHNLLKDPARTKEAFLARDTGKLTLAGPFKLKQGGMGAVGRFPVFINDEKGDPFFWGFTIALIRFPDVLKRTHLAHFQEQGFLYTLWRINPDTGEKQVIVSSSRLPVHPVDTPFTLPNGIWTLSAAPLKGWKDPGGLALKTGLALIFSLLISYLIRVLLLRKEMAIRIARELGERNEKLKKEILERKLIEADLFKTKAQLEKSNLQLKNLSATDPLTKLANRRRFDAAMSREHARHARSGAPLSVIMLDIDNFKAFNDRYGHLKGDHCLQQIAGVILENVERRADIAARYGGEEFACILPETDLNGAKILAEQIRSGIEQLAIPHHASPTADVVTASFGTATVSSHAGLSAPDIIALADEALYRAKQSGRNRIEANTTEDTKKTGQEKKFIQLVWQDAFCSGNHLIDTQHQTLFRMSNDLLEAIESSCPLDRIIDMSTRLLDDINKHFHDEEAILESICFPGWELHRREHARLYKKGVELGKKLSKPNPNFDNIFKFLIYEMVFRHMNQRDREFFPFIGPASLGNER